MILESHWLGKNIDYLRGLVIQEERVHDVYMQKKENHVLYLEHAPVYTIGRTRDQSSLGPSTTHLPHPVVEISRGGQATYHGPGQLIAYPIVNLHPLGNDLHAYVRGIEKALILTCAEYGVTAIQRAGLTGVWVGNKKLASIGIGVRKWITLHGLAINLTRESLNGFLSITPCGIQGVTMTCLEKEAGAIIDSESFAKRFHPHITQVLTSMEKPQM